MITSVAFSQKEYKETDDSIIIWNQYKKLNWEDYNGEIDSDMYGSAYTVYRIEIIPNKIFVDDKDQIQNIDDVNIVTYFYKNKSWTTSYGIPLLAHEQLHFDIAELFARKIRKRFSELKNNKEYRFSQYQMEYDKLMNACKNFQKKYDRETKHGSDIGVNKHWVNTVKNSLKELKDYS